MMIHTSQYSRSFIPAATKLWNELPSITVEAADLQKFKLGANIFLLGVDGPESTLIPSVFKIVLYLVDFLVLSNILFGFIVVSYSF